jgi:hypothetical protein
VSFKNSPANKRQTCWLLFFFDVAIAARHKKNNQVIDPNQMFESQKIPNKKQKKQKKSTFSKNE